MIPVTWSLYLAAALLAGCFYVVAGSFPPPLSPNEIGPAAYPRVVAAGLIALVVLDLVATRGAGVWIRAAEFRVPAIAGILMVGAVMLAMKVGYFVVLPGALFGGLWLLGSRSLLANAAFSIGFSAFVWLVFDYALGLPIGRLGA